MRCVPGENGVPFGPHRPSLRSALPALILAALAWVPAHDPGRDGVARATSSVGVTTESPPSAMAHDASFRALLPVGSCSSADAPGGADELDGDDSRPSAPIALTHLVSAPKPCSASPPRPVADRTNPLFLKLERFRC